jgi:hypothetical protein
MEPVTDVGGKGKKEMAFMYFLVRSKDVLVEGYRCMKVLYPSPNTINTQHERVLTCETDNTPSRCLVSSRRRSRTPNLLCSVQAGLCISVRNTSDTYNLAKKEKKQHVCIEN